MIFFSSLLSRRDHHFRSSGSESSIVVSQVQEAVGTQFDPLTRAGPKYAAFFLQGPPCRIFLNETC